jgi:intein/homing endonuclease
VAIIDLNSCDSACLQCIKAYKKKHNLQLGDKFELHCKGIPKNYIPETIAQTLSEEEKLTALTLVDPVAWAAKNLDWHCEDPDGSIWKRKNPNEYFEWVSTHPGEDICGKSRYHRLYQKNLLRCTSKYKVVRWGRQCLTGDTEVLLWNGTKKQIKDISIGDKIYSLDEETKRIKEDLVKNKWMAGKKKIFVIKTKFGKTIKCSDAHKFYIINNVLDNYHNKTIETMTPKWLSIQEGLKSGDKIATPYKIQNRIQEDIGKLAPLLGYFLTDGSSSKNQSSKFTNNAELYKKEFEELCEYFGSKCKWYPKGKGHDLIISNGRGQKNPVRDLLERLGLINITGPEKFIPDCVMNSTDDNIRLFLNRFWAGDGYISTWQRTGRSTFKTEIGNLQESLKLIQQLKFLFLRFGIHSYIKKEGNNYRLVISNKFSIQNFLKEIINIPLKVTQAEYASEKLSSISDTYFLKTEDILWDYVKSIEEIEEQETYDIETELNHNFIANEFIVHNSGKSDTLAVSILYNIYVKPGKPEEQGFSVVLVTPYQSQIDLIFKRLEELINSNIDLKNSIKRNVKAPNYKIELWNGSTVSGFTAGTKSGGNADAVRGQHADYLLFDEGDYLSAQDVESALSVTTNSPNAFVWMSSTPTGKREKFYSNCYSRMYREFYQAATDNPLWTSQMDAHFKEQMTSIAYEHEILAKFGEQEQGIFQNIFIQAAKAKYQYKEYRYDSKWIYTIGVDWNDIKNGTTIAVVGYSPTTNHWYLIDRDIVRKEGWTQLAACERIAEYNRIWHPVAIYVDKGHGGAQYEVLRKFGYDSTIDPTKGHTHPDSKLKDIVFQYDFGSKVTIHDLFTQEEVEKPAKPFLVENTMRRFETHSFSFPESDKSLEAQLSGYVIDHISPSGTPTFKAGNEEAGDHLLDAVMLALVAFTLQKTPFGIPVYLTGITFSGFFGEKVERNDPGSILVPRDQKRVEQTKREHLRPENGRSFEMESAPSIVTSSSDNLPASNINKNNDIIRTWSWDGFMRDLPPPSPTKTRFNRIGRSGNSRRKNI